MGDNRNVILAAGLALAVILLWDVFIMGPQRRDAAEARRAAAVEEMTTSAAQPAPTRVLADSREAAIADTADLRIPIRSEALEGSLLLRGGRFDDLRLLRYREEVAEDSPPVTFLNPANAPGGYFIAHGWQSPSRDDLPNPTDTVWRVIDGDALTPQTPIVLGYDSEDGLSFRRTVTLDENYLFTVTDQVFNTGPGDVALRPIGLVRRYGVPDDLTNFMILHEGAVGVLDDRLIMTKYRRLERDAEREDDSGRGFARRELSQGGWLGFTDKYWLGALALPPDASYEGAFRVRQLGDLPVFEAQYALDQVIVPAGGAPIEVTSYVFAGAKRVSVLRQYEQELGITRLTDAVDWGFMEILTRPFFYILDFFGKLIGNFGVAILILTVMVKLVFFPIANSSYRSMARMKAVQPEMQRIREQFKDEPRRMQEENLKLFQREKVNPVAGCLPLLLQMPVFYALYKTLFVTIEMRHAPFFGWIQDLSARDPTNVWNLFGLLPYDPATIPLLGGLLGNEGFLGLGVWPLFMGLTMAAMQTLNPPPADKIQQRMFQLMPVIFTFILAPFAAGLVIYWAWNNLLSFAQQYLIMRRQRPPVDTPIGSFLAKRFAMLTGPSGSGGSSNDGGSTPRLVSDADDDAQGAAKVIGIVRRGLLAVALAPFRALRAFGRSTFGQAFGELFQDIGSGIAKAWRSIANGRRPN